MNIDCGHLDRFAHVGSELGHERCFAAGLAGWPEVATGSTVWRDWFPGSAKDDIRETSGEIVTET
jgi:hypothetical protein